MKKFITTSLIIVAALFTKAMAQDCSFYFPTKVGTTVVTTYYDKKGKETSKLYQKVLDYKEGTNYQEVKVQNRTEAKNSEDVPDSLLIHEFTLRCEDGKFEVNWDSYMNSDIMNAYQGMDIEISTNEMFIPSNLKAGQTLPDASATVTVRNSGIKLVSITINVTNRKVEKFEKVTTSAGTFDCVKITADTDTKVLFKKVHTSSAQWMAPGVGVVKTENYDKKGKLESSSVITEIIE